MKFEFEIATVSVVVVFTSSISICAIARVVVGSSKNTSFLQGYAIGVIALIAYMGIVASSKK